jgi:hypothetical protein
MARTGAEVSVPLIAITSDGTVWIVGTDIGGRMAVQMEGPCVRSRIAVHTPQSDESANNSQFRDVS